MTASDWSAVDNAKEPQRFVAGLDTLRTDSFFVQSKARIAARLGRAAEGHVLDVGCGTGEDAAEAGAIGIESSRAMCSAARERHPRLPLVAADARALPVATASADALRADRVVQHLSDAPRALEEWRRVLRIGGRVVTFDPDLSSARIDGISADAAAAVLGWRVGTRPGAPTVTGIRDALERAGFDEVVVESVLMDVRDLDRADGIMGIAGWADHAAAAGRVSTAAARRWRDDVNEAARAGTLRYRCDYILASGRAR